MSRSPHAPSVPFVEIPADELPVGDIPYPPMSARRGSFDVGEGAAATSAAGRTNSRQPRGRPQAERSTASAAGAIGVLGAIASGLSYAWIGFQVILALTVGVARVTSDGPAFAIETGSMQPLVPVGSVVVTKPVEFSEIQPSDIVSFQDPGTAGRIVTHRVVEASAGAITTKGDANAQPDSTAVAPNSVLGKAFIVVPAVAKPVVWIQHGAVAPLSGWLASCLVAAVLIYVERRRACTPDEAPNIIAAAHHPGEQSRVAAVWL